MNTRSSQYANRLGQSILEYTIIIAVAAAALMAMQLYVQRSMQAQLKAIDKQAAPRAVNETRG